MDNLGHQVAFLVALGYRVQRVLTSVASSAIVSGSLVQGAQAAGQEGHRDLEVQVVRRFEITPHEA